MVSTLESKISQTAFNCCSQFQLAPLDRGGERGGSQVGRFRLNPRSTPGGPRCPLGFQRLKLTCDVELLSSFKMTALGFQRFEAKM
jgi:hypothetical protein